MADYACACNGSVNVTEVIKHFLVGLLRLAPRRWNPPGCYRSGQKQSFLPCGHSIKVPSEFLLITDSCNSQTASEVSVCNGCWLTRNSCFGCSGGLATVGPSASHSTTPRLRDHLVTPGKKTVRPKKAQGSLTWQDHCTQTHSCPSGACTRP